MFTVIPRPLIIDHNVADKNVDVIDHNADQKPRKWTRDPNKASRKDSLSLPELLKQKDDLLEADMKNRKRIKELEKEREEVLTLFEPTYKENQALRGHILYGPATVKIRELQKERKELHDYVLKLTKEKNMLAGQLKEAMKKSNTVRNHIQMKNWKDTLDTAKRKNREREEKNSKSKIDAIVAKGQASERDLNDLQIEILESEIKSLQKSVNKLKKEKHEIDTFRRTCKVERKPTIMQDTVHDKINVDIEQFATRLKEMEGKHFNIRNVIEKAKQDKGIVTGEHESDSEFSDVDSPDFSEKDWEQRDQKIHEHTPNNGKHESAKKNDTALGRIDNESFQIWEKQKQKFIEDIQTFKKNKGKSNKNTHTAHGEFIQSRQLLTNESKGHQLTHKSGKKNPHKDKYGQAESMQNEVRKRPLSLDNRLKGKTTEKIADTKPKSQSLEDLRTIEKCDNNKSSTKISRVKMNSLPSPKTTEHTPRDGRANASFEEVDLPKIKPFLMHVHSISKERRFGRKQAQQGENQNSYDEILNELRSEQHKLGIQSASPDTATQSPNVTVCLSGKRRSAREHVNDGDRMNMTRYGGVNDVAFVPIRFMNEFKNVDVESLKVLF